LKILSKKYFSLQAFEYLKTFKIYKKNNKIIIYIHVIDEFNNNLKCNK